MPSFTSFALFALAVAGAVNAEDCPLESLASLASSTNLQGCTTDSGISVATISALTMDQVMAACTSSSCMGLMNDLKSANLGDCTIPGTNVSVQSDVLDQVATMCSGSGSAGAMVSVGSSSSDSATTVGDSSGDASGSKITGTGSDSSSSSSTSAAGSVAVGVASAFVVAAVSMLL
ncbi:hypothetical protein DVH05_020030 [Phytophthora capsici]|uniref:Elicitin n=1 Tax=Phytophthora capsici TaxID=4784 RepID=A0A0A7DNW5_PHYCP|nr:elicitin 510832 [Phytophthora capsici]KAG1709375.1 hypothetical protein DVH05_020030 [Phytophthora capsici]|eukprot:jgi/Phyca11/510832/fgenesh2_kg.PHYCAscaffold_68_\